MQLEIEDDDGLVVIDMTSFHSVRINKEVASRGVIFNVLIRFKEATLPLHELIFTNKESTVEALRSYLRDYRPTKTIRVESSDDGSRKDNVKDVERPVDTSWGRGSIP